MKAAIEYFILMFVLMFSIFFIFNMIGMLRQIHDAHAYRDRVVSLIENFEGDSARVQELMKLSQSCSTCSYRPFQEEGRIGVTVSFKLRLNILKFERPIELKGLTQLQGSKLT